MRPPRSCGMPPLTQNIEGLRRHALLIGIFVGPPEATPAQRRWRSWPVHCLTKAARHYDNARKLMLMDSSETDRVESSSQPMPLFYYSFEMEDRITSLDKAIICIQALHGRGEFPSSRVTVLGADARLLRQFRNKQEHIHMQLASGQIADGPILVAADSRASASAFRSYRWRSLRSTVRSMQLTSISPVYFRNTIQHRFRRYR